MLMKSQLRMKLTRSTASNFSTNSEIENQINKSTDASGPAQQAAGTYSNILGTVFFNVSTSICRNQFVHTNEWQSAN